MPRKQKSHVLTVTVRFDKPVTRRMAKYHLRNELQGTTYYTDCRDFGVDAETLKVSSVK